MFSIEKATVRMAIVAVVTVLITAIAYAYFSSGVSAAHDSGVINRWSSRVNAVPVFRESEYRIRAPRYMVLTTDKTTKVHASGSAFLLEMHGGVYLVTAKHVVGRDRPWCPGRPCRCRRADRRRWPTGGAWGT